VTADDRTPNSLPVSGPRQFLTFSLGAERYGVDILRVQEIRGWSPVTKVPNLPPHVLGVLNLRGNIVPVIDLRVRFGLPSAEFTALTVIVVLSSSSRMERGKSARWWIRFPMWWISRRST